MKKVLVKIFSVVFILFSFWALGRYIWISDPRSQHVPFPVSILVYLMRGIIEPITHPLAILLTVIVFFIGYYLYDNFIKKKEKTSPLEERNDLESDGIIIFDEKRIKYEKNAQRVREVFLGGTILVIVWTLFVVLQSLSAPPGSGMVSFVLLFPVIPVWLIVFPVYFIALALRYSREKSAMNPLDKIMFYILLLYMMFLCFIILNKLLF